MSRKKPKPRLPEGVFRGQLVRGAYGVYVPENYEPNYSYPVLVLLHGRGKGEGIMLKAAPRISRRNYVAVALRAPDKLGVRRTGRASYSWMQFARRELEFTPYGRIERKILLSSRDCWYLHDYVLEVLTRLSDELSLDMRRVYLVGHGEGGAAALRLAMGRPSHYAGVAVLNGWLPAVPGPWISWPQVRRLRGLVVHGTRDRRVPIDEGRRIASLLFSAGVDVQFVPLSCGHHLHREMLATLNEWLMQGCNGLA